MKVFNRIIQDKITGQFLKVDGSWTAEKGEAAQFATIKEVFDYQQQHGLKNVQLLLETEHGAQVVDLD